MGSDQVIIVFGSKDDHSKWNGTIPVEKSNGMTKNKWPNEVTPSHKKIKWYDQNGMASFLYINQMVWPIR